MAMLITEINRNSRIRLFAVTELHRSPYRGPGGFGRSSQFTNSKPDNGLGHEHMAAMDSLSWHSQQPAMPNLSDEELAHAYFATP